MIAERQIHEIHGLEAAWAGIGRDPADADIRALVAAGIPPMRGGAARGQMAPPREGLRPAVAGAIPFTSAAHEHTEPFVDKVVTPGTSQSPIDSPFDVPATGYLRNIWIVAEATGGALGAGVLNADYPFNLFANISLTDVNGGPLFGPLDGYAALQQNIYGGAAGGVNDPRVLPWYDGSINAAFALRIPLEISHHDGMGSLANQNSSTAYKLYLTTNTSANLFDTAPTTVPEFRIRVFVEAWTIPNEQDLLGRPQQQMPPRLGTTQYVSHFIPQTQTGANTVRLTRTGNLYRTLVIIARSSAAGTPRDDSVFADPVDLRWDERLIHAGVPQKYITGVLMREKIPDLTARDTGVFAFPFNASNHNTIGDDDPRFWWPTAQSSRVELQGSTDTAGRWQIITTDVAPVEVAPEERVELESATGFTPEVGTPVRA